MKKIIYTITICNTLNILNPFPVTAQFAPGQSDPQKQLHHEIVTDPYLANPYNNQKTSPAYKFKNDVRAKLMTGSSIFTTQVNVNSNGQNIIGDAANEPSIAVSVVNKNEMVIGWRQFDNISSSFRQAGWGYSSDTGQTWTFPGVIEPGVFRSDPVLDINAGGNFFYNSLTNSPTYQCKVFESSNGGAAWNAGTDAAGGDKQWMAIDRTSGTGNGNIYSFWSSAYSSCAPGFFTRSTNGNINYEPCTEVDSNPHLGTMAIDKSGILYIGGIGNQYDSMVVIKSMDAQLPGSVITWNPPVSVYLDGYLSGWSNVNPQGLLGQVNIDVDISNGAGQNNVYVLASVSRLSNLDPCDVMFARSTDGGLTWSAPIRINDDNSTTNTQWFGTMSVAPDGRIDAVWLDTREDLFGLDSSALYYSYSLDQGVTWSVNEKMSDLFDPHVGYPVQMKMGDYFDMTSDSNGVHLAWANTLNGEEDVYYSYIMPPVSTAVDEIITDYTFSVYPNPSKGNVQVRSSKTINEITIVNPLGQVVYLAKPQAKNTFLEIYNDGIYLVIIKSSGNAKTIKLIIRR